MVSFDESKKMAADRETMVQCHLRARDITDPRVLDAIARLPREAFVTPAYTHQAYADNPLPIGMGQTISQPYIVALMTQSLALTGDESVLEIGTGSGYQTALLAALARHVCTIERVHELAESAPTVLARLGYNNIDFCIGDGSAGWPEHRTFDRIILTAGIPQISGPLLDQLNDPGILVAPVGPETDQRLRKIEKRNAQLHTHTLCPCRFVKLIGKHGFTQ